MANSSVRQASTRSATQLLRQGEAAAAQWRRSVTRGLDFFGVRPTWSTPIDLRGKTEDPVVATHLANGHSFVFEVPLERCRGMEGIGLRLGPRTLDPFVLTLKAYASGACLTFEDSPLAQYYDHFQPKSAAHVLGLTTNSSLGVTSAHAAFLPWETTSPGDCQGRSPSVSGAGRHCTDTGVPAGSKLFGPVSQDTGTRAMKQLIRCFRSVRKHGYHSNDHKNHDITGVVLLDGEDWALSIRGANHRGIALAALGYPRVPITIRPRGMNTIIRRSEVGHWPHVRNRLFTREQALEVFDRILAGRPPKGAIPSEWLSVSSQCKWNATVP